MKKTTKILLVLAAVVAMTIGAVSTVMAADEYPNIAAWDGNEKEGYTATKEDGSAIKSTWAVDPTSGIYYYFDGTGEMVTNEFIATGDDWYYVGKNGAMHTGWLKFTAEEGNDAILEAYNERSEIGEILSDDAAEAYEEEVWAYFDSTGAALKDSWIQTESGLWYYMEDIVMVAGDYSFEVDDVKYGFAEDGRMYVGWEKVFRTISDDEETPTNEAKNDMLGWVYYNTDGSMAESGWKKLDDTWYYFVEVGNNNSRFRFAELSGDDTVIYTNTYIADGKNMYYFDGDGKMAKGSVTLGKTVTTSKADFLAAENEGEGKLGPKTSKIEKTVYFNSLGEQVYGEQEGKYYLKAGSTNVFKITNNEYGKDDTVIEYNDLAVPATSGEMVKDVFVVDGDKYYYYDKDGNKVSDDLVDIYGLTVGIVGGKLVKVNGTTERVSGTRYYFSDINGTLTINGKSVAYGADVKATDKYDVEVVAKDATNEELVKLAQLISDSIGGKKRAVGETVSYTVSQLKYDVQFMDITVAYGSKPLGGVVYSGSKTTDANHGYTFSFKIPDLSDDFYELADNEEDVIVIKIATVPVYDVVLGDKNYGEYIVGETVVLDAPANMIFKAAGTSGDDLATLNAGNIKYVIGDDENATAFDAADKLGYYVDEDENIFREKITFVMPAVTEDIELVDADTSDEEYVLVDAYKVAFTTGDEDKAKNCENVETQFALYAKDDVVTVAATDTKYDKASAYTVVCKNEDTFSVALNGNNFGTFTMPAQNVTINGAKATEEAQTVTITCDASDSIVVKVDTTEITYNAGYVFDADATVTITAKETANVVKTATLTYADTNNGTVTVKTTITNGVLTFNAPAVDSATLVVTVGAK